MRAIRAGLLAAAIGGAMTAPAFAAEKAAGELPLPPAAELAGVYKERFANGLVSGESYESENILELVEVSPDRMYVRLALEFFNGHQCSLWGVAHRERLSSGTERLSYRPRRAEMAPLSAGDPPCQLSITLEADPKNAKASPQVTLHDEGGGCRMLTCGARGSYEGISFPSEKRRPIRYLPRLLASPQYNAAVEEEKTPPTEP